MHKVRQKHKKVDFLTVSFVFFLISPIVSYSQHSATFRDIIISFILTIMFSFIYNIKIKIELNHAYALLLWIFAIISTISASGRFDRSAITYLLFVLFYIITTSRAWDSSSLNTIFKVYIILAFFSSLAIIGGFIFNTPYSWQRYSLDLIGIHKNPNYVASFINGAYCIVLYTILFCRKNKIVDLKFIFIAITMIIGCIFTGTRAAYLTIVICTLLQLIFFIFSEGYKTTRLWILIPIMVLMYYIVTNYIPQNTINRLLKAESYTDASRIYAWETVFCYFLEAPILGLGIGGSSKYLKSLNSIDYLHNIILELLCDQGLVGLGLFISMIFSRIHRTKKVDRLFLLCMFFVLFFPIIFQNGLIGVSFWWPIIMFRIMCKCSETNHGGITEIIKRQ